MATDEQGKKMGQIIANGRMNAFFKQRLLQDAALRITRVKNTTGIVWSQSRERKRHVSMNHPGRTS